MSSVLRISPELNKLRETFFKAVFGSESGYICIATLAEEEGFKQSFWEYPNQLQQLLEHINLVYQGRNVYFCPQLLEGKERTKHKVKTCTVLWSDLDACPPETVDPQPSIALESSPGRYQGFWLLQEPAEPIDAEEASHRIAFANKDKGADQSGWDLTQLLRVPGTYNMKYEEPGHIPVVNVIKATSIRYTLKRFEELPSVPGWELVDTPMPPETMELDPDEVLQKHRFALDKSVFELYSKEPVGSWSEPLWQLELLCLEAGLSKPEVFAICNAAKCNKFAREGRDPRYLWKDILRADIRIAQRLQLIGASAKTLPSLLTEEEQRAVQAETGFVERFILWGQSSGDAAPQYFQAGAFTILSTILSGAVKLPTSFGTMTPNLWFMILADTTLTRKSTAMDMAMEVLLEVMPDAVLATDGSIEGLLSSISSRPGRPGIFWRDEFSGLLAAIKQKDYLAGMGETLTKLYDGKYQKRILRKETIELRDPIVNIFAGGIRTRILDLMDHENISSGFLPRFIVVEAESDIKNFKPIGPVSKVDDVRRVGLVKELMEVRDRYQNSMTIKVGDQTITTPSEFNAELSEEAWFKYNEFELQMVKYGLDSGSPDVFTPTMDRLAKSGLKCAVLLAAARQTPQGDKVQVEVQDLLHSFFYVQKWADWAADVVANVGKSVSEKRVDLVLGAIERAGPNGTTRSKVMQNYHLTSRDADWILDTLEQRGLVRRAREGGRAERLFPATTR